MGTSAWSRVQWSAGFRGGLAAGIAACMSCGGGSDGGPNDPSPALEISPTGASVVPGGPAVSFTATLTGIDGTITWDLDGPGSISAASGSATSYTPPATASAQTTATLTAAAGSESDAATITITSSPPGETITVTGTVVDSCLQPVADVVVWIRNRGITRTNASGQFSFAGVPTPYDIGTLQQLQSWKLIRIFAGLTAPAVRLKLGGTGGSVHQATLQGSLTVGAGSTAIIPVPLGRRTRLVFQPPEDLASIGVLDDANPYGFEVAWCEAPTVTGTVRALQYTTETNPNLAQFFDGYGRSEVTLADGMTTATGDVILEAVGTVSLTGVVAPPTGYTLLQRSVGLDADGGTELPLTFNFAIDTDGLPLPFAVPTPSAPGIALVVWAESQGGSGVAESWRHGVLPADNVTIGMDPAPNLVAPAPAAEVDLPTQTFSWTSSVGGVQGMFVSLSFPLGQGTYSRALDYQVFTLGRSYQLPLPQEFGLSAIPAGSRGEWHVGSSNEPSVAGMVDPTRDLGFDEGALGTVLPIPEANEIRHARHLGDTRFTMP